MSKQRANNATVDHRAIDQAFMAMEEALTQVFEKVEAMLRASEADFLDRVNGHAKVIRRAGPRPRDHGSPHAPPGKVAVVHQKPGKLRREAILEWPAVPGATGYVIEVNYTPRNPAGPWIPLIPSVGPRRTLAVTTPGGQLLARVASIGSGETQSEWSDAVLVTTAS
jgi:hypothetical protein